MLMVVVGDIHLPAVTGDLVKRDGGLSAQVIVLSGYLFQVIRVFLGFENCDITILEIGNNHKITRLLGTQIQRVFVHR